MCEIRTQRLILRPFTVADAATVLSIHSIYDVIRWLSNPPWVPMETLAQAEEWIDRTHERHAVDPHQRTLAIEVAEIGTVVGAVNVTRLHRLDGGFVGEYETGWHLHPDAAGRGYATEAARAMIASAFDGGLDELTIGMWPDNEPSAALARRLGAEELGVDDDPWYGGQTLLFRISPPHL